MKASFQGGLLHHFWGTYHCTIGLQFESEQLAKDAVRMLGPKEESKEGWSISEQDSRVITCVMNSEGLDALKKRFQTNGMDDDMLSKIDSLSKSIDRGEPFHGELEIEIHNENQTLLF